MQTDFEFAVEATRHAGALILKGFRGEYDITHKSNNNPVTTLDLAADRQLREAFVDRFPDDGWLSEETLDSPTRLSRQRVWVVDPLDGTKEFVDGLPEFAVSLALVEDGRPKLAVVYNPARDDIFTAERHQGAHRGGERVRISQREKLDGAQILCSRSEHAKQLSKPSTEWGTVRPVGSIAYKLALLAAGEADITISYRPKNEWDVCAGGLLVTEAGGTMTDLKGSPLFFNRKNTLIQGIVAANPVLHKAVLHWISTRPDTLSHLE